MPVATLCKIPCLSSSSSPWCSLAVEYESWEAAEWVESIDAPFLCLCLWPMENLHGWVDFGDEGSAAWASS
jgi:hypothetical protein